jgi:hypothetical protein
MQLVPRRPLVAKNCKFTIGVRPAILRSQSAAKLFIESYGHVGRVFELRPFSTGSILTLRKRIEPLRFRIDVGVPAKHKRTHQPSG